MASATWLAFGLAVALLLAIEAAYRAQAGLRGLVGRWHAQPAARNLEAEWEWYRRVRQETAATSFTWRPFVYYRRKPFHGAYVNVDSLGRRVTRQAVPSERAVRDVFLFGGSPMWGVALADSMTIPSRVAQELAKRGVRDVEVTNFGEEGYVFTQDVIELLLRLRAGARPAVVVFYGGYNGIEAAMQNGRAGGTKVEEEAARAFGPVHSLFTWRTDLLSEGEVMTRLAGMAVGRLQIVRRFVTPPAPPSVPDDSVANAVAHDYLSTVEAVEALARAYDFTPLYAWMPILDSSKAHESPLERAIYQQDEQQAFMRRFLELHAAAARKVEPRVREIAPGRFLQLTGLFAADTETVFLDDEGHLTEAASRTVAAVLAGQVERLLGSGTRHRTPGPRAEAP